MKAKRIFPLIFFSALILLAILVMQPLEILGFRQFIDVLYPAGPIAAKQRDLLFIIQLIMLIVVIPVFILTYVFTWKYNSANPHGKYNPDLDHNWLAEVIWWGVPLVLTAAIGTLMWIRTHELDPYKPIASDKKEIVIEVVALQWKWLFLYPEEGIASLNFLQIPVGTPIHFKITADAPMNSFWIPKLGGQIYAMPMMQTELYLLADQTGDFRGSSANISGKGFSGMHFITRASSEEEYRKWLDEAKKSENTLDYEALALPSEDNPPEQFLLKQSSLFNDIMMKYMENK